MARALVGEADWHEPDHRAIAHVLLKRWRIYRRNKAPISFPGFMRLYSSPLRTKEARARAIQRLPWGRFSAPPRAAASGARWVSWATRPTRLGWGGRRWDKVRVFVEKWGAGRVKDPCPRALHWGGTMDRPQGHWYPVDCGRTRNIFYRVRRAQEPRS